MRRALTTLFLTFLLSSIYVCQLSCQETPADQIDRAVELMNKAHYSEAVGLLLPIVKADPQQFYAYVVLWESMQHLSSEADLKASIRTSLKVLSAIPITSRTEAYYQMYEFGLGMLGNDVARASMHQEQLKLYPLGRAMQNRLLEEAAKQQNPFESAQMYRDVAMRFPPTFAVVNQANRSRFYLVRDHRQFFAKGELLSAGEAWRSSESLSIQKEKPSFSYLLCLRELAEALKLEFADASLADIRLAEEYVAAHWAETDVFDDLYGTTYWPTELDDCIRLKRWEEARRIGQRLQSLLENGVPGPLAISTSTEAAFRANYGLALEMTGSPSLAFDQFGLAWALDPVHVDGLSSFLLRHPEFDKPLATQLILWHQKLRGELSKRDKAAADALLAAQLHETASPFSLETLDGGRVRLSDHQGTLILVFWASWCQFCKQEMAELQQVKDSNAGDKSEVLAVSVDTDRGAARKLIEGLKLSFSIAFSDGLIDGNYGVDVVPQVYVIDRHNTIRFHLAGTQPDLAGSLQTILAFLDAG